MTEAVANMIIKLIDALKKFISFLNPARMVILAFLMLFVVLGISFWENRQVVYNAVTSSVTASGDKFSADIIPPLQEPTKASIKNVVDRNQNIVAVQITRTDFRNNIRDTVHFYSDVQTLVNEFAYYEETKINYQQLFTVGDVDQNERMIKIIEQEFVCVDMPPNISMMMPSSTKYAKQICSISIPPRYGKMVGYVNVWLREPIGATAMPYYKNLARSISDEVYDRDVMKGKN